MMDTMAQYEGGPLFPTVKIKIKQLSDVRNVRDYQLKEHFITMSNLYQLQCECTHPHSKVNCRITNEVTCPKCDKPTKMLISFQALMFHPNLMEKKMFSCTCFHVHYPPCNNCINCNLLDGTQCIVTTPFECNLTTGMFKHHLFYHSYHIILSFTSEYV